MKRMGFAIAMVVCVVVVELSWVWCAQRIVLELPGSRQQYEYCWMNRNAEATVVLWYSDCWKVPYSPSHRQTPNCVSSTSDGAWLAHLAPRFRTLKACFAGGVVTRLKHAEVTTFEKAPTPSEDRNSKPTLHMFRILVIYRPIAAPVTA
jgi:hypothetical protein